MVSFIGEALLFLMCFFFLQKAFTKKLNQEGFYKVTEVNSK